MPGAFPPLARASVAPARLAGLRFAGRGPRMESGTPQVHFRSASAALGLSRRHLSEQYLTSCQSRAHFRRHVNGRPQARQVLAGKSVFLRIFMNGSGPSVPAGSSAPPRPGTPPTSAGCAQPRRNAATASETGVPPLVTSTISRRISGFPISAASVAATLPRATSP